MQRILLLFLLVVLFGCGSNPKKLKQHYQPEDFEIELDEKTGNELKIHYTGCGGMLIKKGGIIIMTDPFFSNTNLLPVGLKAIFGGYIKQKEKNIKHGIDRSPIKPQTAKAILTTHSHYDHLLDVPWLYQHDYLDKSNIKILGNHTMTELLNHYQINSTDVEPLMATSRNKGTWIIDVPGIRILPIKSQHAPHLGHVKAFAGEYQGTLRKKSNNKSHISDWREGQTLSYVVDFLNGAEIDFRMFIQTSSSDAPLGFPSQNLLDEHDIDLAVLCVASYENSNDYPKQLIEHITPKGIIFVHWENFFRGYRKKKPKTVIGTNVKAFPKLVKSYYDEDKFWMPKPGVTVTVKY